MESTHANPPNVATYSEMKSCDDKCEFLDLFKSYKELL